jgi:virulence factor
MSVKEISKVRVCIIGAGEMANKVHYPSLVSFDDVEIAGICAMNPERLYATAQRFNVPQEKCYQADHPTGYRKMIETVAPDGIYAIGHPHVMIDIWIWCLEKGLNLYIEKPMGITVHQARSLAYLAEKKNCITQVSHQRRSCPLLVKMRNECLKRGSITHSVCEFFKCEPQPFLGPRDHMLDDCTHSIDTIRWMCGGKVVKVQSHCMRVGTPDINWIGATLYFNNGSIGYLVNNWSSGRRIFRVQMHAPEIYIDAEVEGKAYLYADGDYEGIEYDTKVVSGSDEFYIFGGYQAKNREFIDSVKTGNDRTSSPFHDCVKTMEVAETILAQSLLKELFC